MTDVTSTPADSASADPAQTPSESAAPSTASPSPSDAGRVPRYVVGLDSSVTQGNRVTLTTPNLETDPIGDLKAKIVDHFDSASHVVADLRALADEIESLLNKVRTGI